LGVVEALQVTCDERGVLLHHGQLRLGQSVRLLTGPFSDFIGELDALSDSGRVRVLLEIMGRKVSTVLLRDHVAPASDCL
jgi:transcriptional antiterminator RfaH